MTASLFHKVPLKVLIIEEQHMKLAIFKCKNVKSQLPELAQLCEGNDMVFLQKTWLVPDDTTLLSIINEEKKCNK